MLQPGTGSHFRKGKESKERNNCGEGKEDIWGI